METSPVENHYFQAVNGFHLYISRRERDAGRHIGHIANAAEWLSRQRPADDPRDWVFEAVRDALRENGGSVRRRNAGGGFTESYLDGDAIRTRQVA